MSPTRTRLLLIAAALVLLAGAAALVLGALRDNLQFFRTPSEIARGAYPPGHTLRVGGQVRPGSLIRAEEGRTLSFALGDGQHELNVRYHGALPDLFHEGGEAVVLGVLDASGTLLASQVLARHDERYRPAASAGVPPPCLPNSPSSR